MSNTFDKIYENKIWECDGVLSGAGSHPRGTVDYINYLYKFKERKILDLGCGDLSIYKGDIFFKNYIGVDIVDVGKYKNLPKDIIISSIDTLQYELYDFDLILIKDVFQHLSNDAILNILNQLLKLKVDMLITNDYHFSLTNENCEDGGYRSLNMEMDPFQLQPRDEYYWESKMDSRLKKTIFV
jgi:SAM-dependent methyltransferase